MHGFLVFPRSCHLRGGAHAEGAAGDFHHDEVHIADTDGEVLIRGCDASNRSLPHAAEHRETEEEKE